MNRRPTPQYIVLAILLLWAFAAQLTYSGYRIYMEANASRHIEFPFYTREWTRQIAGLQTGYEHCGLEVNDELLVLNGEPVTGAKQMEETQLSLHPGDTLNVTVRRSVAGRTDTLTVPIRTRAARSNSTEWLMVIGLSTFLPLSCLTIGFYIAFARPRDTLAWITFGMLAAFGQLAGSGFSWAIWSPWRELLIAYHALLTFSWPVLMVLFALYFPVPFPFLRRYRWINWLIAAPCLALTGIELCGEFLEGKHINSLVRMAAFDRASYGAIYLLFSAYISAFFALLGFKVHTLETADARRRLNIMIAGCSLALVPVIPVVLAQFGFIPALPVWLETVCVLMLLFFPITMAYVIVVQRAMEVRMVVRSGVRYALASTGVRILRYALIAATVTLTIRLAVGREIWEAAVIGAIGLALVTGFRRISVHIGNWTDRRFFREAYNAEAILTHLSNSVAGIRDKKTLLETVVQRISESLHVDRIAVLLQRGGRFEPVYALGFNGTHPPVAIQCDTATVQLLQREKSASRIYFDDPQSWVHGTSAGEQTALQKLDAQLLLPLSLKNRLLGLISLGPKKSEEPYSRGDLQLLGAVASQTGLALENAELTDSIRREVAQRERLDRELEIAREVQQRLFPQKLPHIEGLDFAGYCRPALGVGGDYYDFLGLPDDCLGIAIGDVSGKGIAAALMMASLQASLRGQIIHSGPALSETVRNINRLLSEASAENRYATFFYAQYEPIQHTVRYVNAGHNPPIVCRCHEAGQQILRLEEGGTVIGLFPDFPYREGRLQLQPGDTLVCFTDGISEAMNSAETEFDETRLIDAIRDCGSRTAAGMITYILERVDRFTAGAPQHDDMTLVVMRVE